MYVYATSKGRCKMVDLKGRDFLKLLDFTPKEINYLIKSAITLIPSFLKTSFVTLFLS